MSAVVQSVASVQQQQQPGRPTQQVQPVSSHFEEATGSYMQSVNFCFMPLYCYNWQIYVCYLGKMNLQYFVTHAGCISADMGRAFSHVCLSVYLFVRSLKG